MRLQNRVVSHPRRPNHDCPDLSMAFLILATML